MTAEQAHASPMATGPTFGEQDVYLFREGTHANLQSVLGCLLDRDGATFRVWAPNAERVSVIGEWNDWNAQADSLARAPGRHRHLGRSVRGVRHGHAYKFRIEAQDGSIDGQGRSVRGLRRDAAGDGIARVEPRLCLGRRGVDGGARAEQRARRADVDLRAAPGLVAPQRVRRACPATARSRSRSPITSARRASRTSNCCRSPSTRSTARGATRPPATSRRPRATARRRTSCTSSTCCISAASASSSTGCPRTFPTIRTASGASTARTCTSTRTAAGLPSGVEEPHLQLRPPRGARLPGVERAVLARPSTTSTACASTRSPRCSTSTTAASPASGCPNAHGGRENLGAIAFLRHAERGGLPRSSRHADDRRGIDGLADGVAAGRPSAAWASA